MYTEKALKLNREPRGGVLTVEKSPSIQEIQKLLGLDSIQPIHLTLSDEEDTKEKENELKDWYEYELREFFESERN